MADSVAAEAVAHMASFNRNVREFAAWECICTIVLCIFFDCVQTQEHGETDALSLESTGF